MSVNAESQNLKHNNKKTLKFTSKSLAKMGIIGALYVVLSFFALPVSSGAIQIRLGEGLTLLPILFVESVPALFIGCLIFNIICGCAIYDIIFGSLITLVSALLTYIVSKFIKSVKLSVFVGGLFPLILNSLFLPLIWLLYAPLEFAYLLQVVLLLVGESLSVYAVGSPLLFAVNKFINKK